MENSKLMPPLFYEDAFNREGRRMRAVLEKEISDGTRTYRLWRSAGKPDLEYPRTENDKYILYVEINGYLASLGMTDFYLVDRCGFKAMEMDLYAGSGGRERYFDGLRESSGDDAVIAALAEEDKKIELYGNDPARQTEYIRSLLDDRVDAYLKAKENGGQSFPDFVGALVMDDLARCMELSAVYEKKRQAEEAARRASLFEKEKARREARNKESEQAVSAAIQVIREGGVLENETIEFFQGRYDSRAYSIFNYLMRLYQVDVPLRTQGWINRNLCSVTIQDGKCEQLRFYGKKNGRGSQKFFECMNALIEAVTEDETV